MGVGLHKASVYLGGGLHVFTELPKRGLLTVLTAPLKTVDPKRSIRGLERRPLKMGSFGKKGCKISLGQQRFLPRRRRQGNRGLSCPTALVKTVDPRRSIRNAQRNLFIPSAPQ